MVGWNFGLLSLSIAKALSGSSYLLVLFEHTFSPDCAESPLEHYEIVSI